MVETFPKLLIIEDDPSIGRVFVRNLSKAGLDVCLARNGREAREALAAGRYDYILCDYQLPDATGDELCCLIRSTPEHATTPIALCTAKAYEVDVDSLINEFGLTQVFYKPFSVREITSAILEALDSASMTAAG